MAYTKPAVKVFQELINAGGSANISPNLPACIIGVASNVVKVDFNDEVAKTRALAATLDTIQNNVGTPTDWEIKVNSGSAYPGQKLDDDTVEVVLANPLVKTYSVLEADITWDAGKATIVRGKNKIGTVAIGNEATNPLPWITNLTHVRVGSLAKVGSKVTFVTSVKDTTENTIIELADASITMGSIEVFAKLRESKAGVSGWVANDDRAIIGTGVSAAIPYKDDATYKYAVEKEVKGFGAPISVYINYKAARSDLKKRITTINSIEDCRNKLGEAHPIDNELAFGANIALANSGGTPIYVVGIEDNTLVSHTAAADLIEGQRVYWITPLTQELSIQAMYKAHVDKMSTPESGKWRVLLANQALPTEFYSLGKPDGGDIDENGFQDNLVKGMVSGSSIMLDEGTVGTKISAGDDVYLTVATDSSAKPEEAVVSDASGNLITLVAIPAVQGEVYFYVSRNASGDTAAQAEAVAAQSNTWKSNRVMNLPGDVMADVDGVNTNVPGYFLQCSVAGLGSGLPAQSGFTNITIAGITDLQHSNFYFKEEELNLMAGAGTVLFVQEAQGTTPYCRHGLTTDMSVLEYREILKVKNWDYLSYYYYDIVKSFIGVWNITPDTIQNIRQTVESASTKLLSRKLPKVGPPLLSFNIVKLEQNANSKDSIDMDIRISIVDPNNYTNIYLQI